ncbi:hypothetical protein [Kordia periserrulae]|nr:hypothetical protein [Kordia periserrulae]
MNKKSSKSLLLIVFMSLVLLYSCSDENDSTSEQHTVGKAHEHLQHHTNDVSHAHVFEVDLANGKNLHNVTKSNFKAFSNEEKATFIKYYISEGGGKCSCEGGCSVECPSGSKPKCQCCSCGWSDCGCEPFAKGAIKLQYEIHENTDGSASLVKKASEKSFSSFANSNLPNASKIAALFDNESVFKTATNGTIQLSAKEYQTLLAKFQVFMVNYSMEQYFEVEYEF